jgi:hypothetical protein
MKRLAVSMALALSMVAAVCADTGVDPEASIAGNYTMVSVNGKPLPAMLEPHGSNTSEITKSEWIWNADGTFSVKTWFRNTINGQVSTTPVAGDAPTFGTWQAGDSGTLNFLFTTGEDSGRGHITAQYTADAITFTLDGFTYVLKK